MYQWFVKKKGELLSVKCQCTGYICVKWPKIVYKEGNQIKWAQSQSFLIDVVIINKILPWAVGLDLAIFCILVHRTFHLPSKIRWESIDLTNEFKSQTSDHLSILLICRHLYDFQGGQALFFAFGATFEQCHTFQLRFLSAPLCVIANIKLKLHLLGAS